MNLNQASRANSKNRAMFESQKVAPLLDEAKREDVFEQNLQKTKEFEQEEQFKNRDLYSSQQNNALSNPRTRIDFEVIVDLVKPNTRVLDIGCGDGSLLELLAQRRQIDGRGLELSQAGVDQCLARGLSVIQGNADRDLVYYPDAAFDYVILSQTLQATYNPKQVLQAMMRIGQYAIVSFPNFGYWRVRASLFFRGRMPVTKELPYSWYDTPNIHFCTVRDFLSTVEEVGAHVEKAAALDRSGGRLSFFLPQKAWNLFGQQAVFLLRR